MLIKRIFFFKYFMRLYTYYHFNYIILIIQIYIIYQIIIIILNLANGTIHYSFLNSDEILKRKLKKYMKKYIVYIQSKSTNFDDVQYLTYIKKIK